jgi:hypothetical protein
VLSDQFVEKGGERLFPILLSQRAGNVGGKRGCATTTNGRPRARELVGR